MRAESTSLKEPSKLFEVTKPNLETLEALFSSEHLAPRKTLNEESEDEFELRRKQFFGL